MKMYKPWYQVASTLKKKSMTVQTRKKCQCLRLFSSCFCIHRKSRKRNEKSQFNLALTVRLGMGIQTPAGRLYCHHCDSFSRLIKNKSGKSSWNGLISIECIDVPFVEVWRAILVIFGTNCATIACNLKGWNGSSSEFTELFLKSATFSLKFWVNENTVVYEIWSIICFWAFHWNLIKIRLTDFHFCFYLMSLINIVE